MSSIGGIYDEETEERLRGQGISDPSRVTLAQLDPTTARAIERMQRLIGHITTPTPSATDAPLSGRVTPGAVERAPAPEIDPIAGLTNGEIAGKAMSEFPNLAWQAIKAGLAKEKFTNDQLNGHIREAEKHQKDIDLLLDLSAELTGYKDDMTDLSQKASEGSKKSAKELLEELKERGIDLWKGEDTKINKEKVSALKDLSKSQMDKLHGNLQRLFTTRIQPKIQEMASVMEALKDILRNQRRVCDKALQLPGRG